MFTTEEIAQQAPHIRVGFLTILPPEVEAIRLRQRNRCAVCGDPFDEDRLPCVDFTQNQQRIRGLLCQACSSDLRYYTEISLGNGKEIGDSLMEIIEGLHQYLRRYDALRQTPPPLEEGADRGLGGTHPAHTTKDARPPCAGSLKT